MVPNCIKHTRKIRRYCIKITHIDCQVSMVSSRENFKAFFVCNRVWNSIFFKQLLHSQLRDIYTSYFVSLVAQPGQIEGFSA